MNFFNKYILGFVVAVFSTLAIALRVLTSQRDKARAEAALHEQNAETAEELNLIYSDLDRVKTEAREQANEKLKTDIKRPASGTDFNSL